ncbi:MAG: helix-turn-helix domain-containing protein [Candidatus Dadabacteria bacterium]|nr:helix-turn-helix domain-containing protein [Candidatus Dadabacteria bacterium]
MGIENRLKKIRKTANMTQREFASKLGVSHTYISELEGGRRTPSKLFMVAVEHVFGVNQPWLAAGQGETYRKDKGHFTEEELGVIKLLRNMSEDDKKIFIALSKKLKKK